MWQDIELPSGSARSVWCNVTGRRKWVVFTDVRVHGLGRADTWRSVKILSQLVACQHLLSDQRCRLLFSLLAIHTKGKGLQSRRWNRGELKSPRNVMSVSS